MSPRSVFLLGLCLAGLVCLACEAPDDLSPIAPSDGEPVDADVVEDVRLGWSPYVGIHLEGSARDAYRDAVRRLQAAGRMQGARIEITRRLSPSDPIFDSIGPGVELLGLISNEYLFSTNIEGDIDAIFRGYPQIRYFQIGNEVTTILPSTGPRLDIETYMAKLLQIYEHVQRRHRGRATLLTQSPLGSGLGGPVEMEKMAALGLADLDPSQVIVAINAYDVDTANQYLGVLGGQLRKFRVWVTESGVRDPDRHLSWVSDVYPRFRNLLRAERVYWYIMWGGDAGGDADFSLIRRPDEFPNYWTSPLFDVLTAR